MNSLLFLSHVLPFPPDSGVAMRTYNILRQLSRRFDVTALCFYRAAHLEGAPSLEDRIAALGRFARVEAFRIPADHARLRRIRDHIGSLVRGQPYTYGLHTSRSYRDRIRALLASGDIALVHVDSLDLCVHLPLLKPLPVICVHHNVESTLLRRRARAERTAWRRAYMLLQARLIERTQERWCSRVALNVAVSEQDRRELRDIAPSGRYTVVPNGVDIEHFRAEPARRTEEELIFVGGADWFPNRDALTYFCTEILPLIRRTRPSLALRWVGKASAADQERFARDYDVELTGYVEDIRPHVYRAACFVVPLRVGGGTRLKILTAWAMGKAVVSTSVGCEGLAAVDGENILIADTPLGFAEAVDAVLRDAELRRSLGEAGRGTVERSYAWDVIGESMMQCYQGLVGHAAFRRNETVARHAIRLLGRGAGG